MMSIKALPEHGENSSGLADHATGKKLILLASAVKPFLQAQAQAPAGEVPPGT